MESIKKQAWAHHPTAWYSSLPLSLTYQGRTSLWPWRPSGEIAFFLPACAARVLLFQSAGQLISKPENVCTHNRFRVDKIE